MEEKSITEIVNNLPNEFNPVKENDRMIYDESRIVLRCKKGHIHKYYLSDVAKENLKCTTCSSGTAFCKFILEFIESFFEAPFVLTDLKFNENSIEYINPVLNIVVSCSTVPCDAKVNVINSYNTIRLSKTTSLSRVKYLFTEFKRIINSSSSESKSSSSESKSGSGVIIEPVNRFKKPKFPIFNIKEKGNSNYCFENV